jgi:hypothetical protein
MKAQALAELLMQHPDWDVGFRDANYGGLFCEVEPRDIEPSPTTPTYNHPEKTWLIDTPWCGPDPEEE